MISFSGYIQVNLKHQTSKKKSVIRKPQFVCSSSPSKMALRFIILTTLLATVASLKVKSFTVSDIQEDKPIKLTCKGDSAWKKCDISKGSTDCEFTIGLNQASFQIFPTFYFL